ncbi:MAG TPA: sulfatase-like hydrolase/transferase [Verrucomicrobiae bacterium]|nr:sulfatase-like hydrolase/transferase [Verrucomicrobiae bacterium]
MKVLARYVWGLSALLLGAPLAFSAGARRPNILFILTDDQNGDTLGCFGGKVLTPTLDRLCREGVKFTEAYTASSVCTPSRYICLTGQYASRCTTARFLRMCPPGQQSNVGFNVQVEPGGWNVGRVLRENGYATGFVGKWHTGAPAILPCDANASLRDPEVARILAENQRRLVEYIKQVGFDYAASVYRGNLKDHKLDQLTAHNMEWVTKGALDFIGRCGDRPFYLQVATTLQHSPRPQKSIGGDPTMTPAGHLPGPLDVQAPRATIAERLKESGISEDMGHATWLDDGVASILNKLEDQGLLENTLILFFSDNGTMGGKGTCYDGGARTPCFLWWKGRLPCGVVCDKLVENIDFVPTIFDVAGVNPPPQMKLDGMSLIPLITNPGATRWREHLFLEIGHTRAVRDGRYKYVAVRYPAGTQKAIMNSTLGRPPYHMDTSLDLQELALKGHPAYFDADQLYDLQEDPAEQKNLAKDPTRASELADLKGRLGEWLSGFGRPFGEFVK